MRVIVTSVLVSSIVTFSIFFARHLLHQDSVAAGIKTQSLAIDPTLSISSLQAQLTLLESDVQKIHNELKKITNLTAYKFTAEDKASSKTLAERIENLELALDKLSSNIIYEGAKNTDGAPKRVREYMDVAPEVVSAQQNALLEAQFDSDSGIPIGEFVSSIDDVIQEMDWMQAQGISCRSTICKVTYATTEESSSGSEDMDWQLMEQLLEHSDGRRVEISYASDSHGNNTMYIQLK